MTLDEFARLILFGTSLEEKLFAGPLQLDVEDLDFKNQLTGKPPIEFPPFPGRPSFLKKSGKANFPSVHRLHEPTERGKVLHFFANHELLAMELMSLALLRFPDAPPLFRNGIAKTIREEQEHLRLYLSRMKTLGIEFGDLPVSNYFWNSMKGMQSPLDFTVQMSLTFEQANLDFSLYFMNAIQRAGDATTAAILERVFREEAGHVKHGLTWFNRWRDSSSKESDWEAYKRLLPLPLTPQRAKGFEFCEEVRRQVGLSEVFIRELRLYSASKGRPPVLWLYNPHCESEIARGRPGFTATEGARKISQDLEAIPLYLCLDQDVVLVHNQPQTEWIESLQKCGFKTPSFLEIGNKDFAQTIRTPKIGGLEPWGWSPDVFDAFQPLLSHLVNIDGGNSPFCKKLLAFKDFKQTGIGELFSKSWSVLFLRNWLDQHASLHPVFGDLNTVGASYSHWESAKIRILQILLEGYSAILKAPYGTSGMQIRTIHNSEELEGPVGGWIRNTLSSQGAIVIEHRLDKICDLSIQMEIKEDCVDLLDVRQFVTGSQNEFRGTYLGKIFPGFASEHRRFFHAALPYWHDFLRSLGIRLRNEGYQGSAGVDAFLWKDKDGKLKLKPMVELNPRWTMGRVALSLEKHLAPGTRGLWLFVPLREIKDRGFKSTEHFVRELENKYPVKLVQKGGDQRIESGVVFTNDPSRAQAVLTVLATLPNPDLFSLSPDPA
jgi:uncharacterized ferritin-like protein (DUF455 family)